MVETWVYCTMSLMITSEMVYERLKTVMDPELHVNIVDLGLIYNVQCPTPACAGRVNGQQKIKVIMTLTTPGCPLAPEIDRLVREAIKPLGEYTIELELVWEPAWTKDRMSEEAKLQLGMV